MARFINTFAGQNWVITPAALALHETPPRDIHAQKWLLTLSGVAIVDFKGNSGAQWLHDTLIILPDVLGPMHHAIATHGIPRPPGTEGNQYDVAFQLEQWAPFATINAIFNEGHSVNSGFAVDVWRPQPFGSGTDAFSNQQVGNLFSGVQVDVAVRDTDAWLYRVGYNFTLLGKITFIFHTF